MTKNIATKITTVDLSGWAGDAALYALTPPLGDIEFVVVSSIDLTARHAEDRTLDLWDKALGIDRTEETLVFPATSQGSVIDWGELAMVPVRDHADALAEMGYEIAEVGK